MKDNKKKIEEQEQLLDHLIEYGGKQYIDDEIQKFDELPEMDIPKDFDDRMDKMFKDAYRKEVRKERLHLGKKVAAAAVIVIGAASVTAMNVKAFREPILNFIFRSSDNDNRTKVNVQETDNSEDQFQFDYIPKGYEHIKTHYVDDHTQITYEYKNSQNQYLYIKIQTKQTYDTYSNLINNDYTKLTKENQTYYYIESTKNRLIWYKNSVIFSIISYEPVDELIKISQNMK